MQMLKFKKKFVLAFCEAVMVKKVYSSSYILAISIAHKDKHYYVCLLNEFEKITITCTNVLGYTKCLSDVAIE